MQQKHQRNGDRERLVHAAHRLANISRHDPIKLFSLLYMLDIRLFRESGRSCTGEFYYAMADGPAPGSLRSLLVMREIDMHAAIGVLTATNSHGPWDFDPKAYCQLGLEILQELEAKYCKVPSRDLAIEDDNAWWRVYNKSRGVGAIIPYEMTLGNTHSVCSSDKAMELKAIGRWFRVGGANMTEF